MLRCMYKIFNMETFESLTSTLWSAAVVLCCSWQSSAVRIEEKSIWTFPKHNLSVHPDGPNPPDAGGEEIQEIEAARRKSSEGPSGCRCEIGQRMAVKQKSVYCVLLFTACITAPQTCCWDVFRSGLQPGKVGLFIPFMISLPNSINLMDISP